MSVLKIRDKNGEWVPVPALDSVVDEYSIRNAIPKLVKRVGSVGSPFATLDGYSIPIGQIAIGSYVGTAATTSAFTEVRLTFDFKPDLILIKTLGDVNPNDVAILLRPDTRSFVIASNGNMGGFTTEWLEDGVSFEGTSNHIFMNAEGTTYNYVAIGLG